MTKKLNAPAANICRFWWNWKKKKQIQTKFQSAEFQKFALSQYNLWQLMKWKEEEAQVGGGEYAA